MPRRLEIVTLEEDDRDVLDQVLSKESVEKLLQSLRSELNEGLEEVRKLRKAGSVTPEQAREARQVLHARRDRFEALPRELIASEKIDIAMRPIHSAIRLCDEVLGEFSGAEQSHTTAVAPVMTPAAS